MAIVQLDLEFVAHLRKTKEKIENFKFSNLIFLFPFYIPHQNSLVLLFLRILPSTVITGSPFEPI